MEETSVTSRMYYKYCITPHCNNTTVSTPNKIFIRIPEKAKKRKLWLRACRRDPTTISTSSRVYVCENHFNLEEDMENFLRYKMMGGKILMKDNVVPHIFDCQKDKKRASTHTDRPTTVKRAKGRIVEEAIASSSHPDELQLSSRDTSPLIPIPAETSTEDIPAEVGKCMHDISIKRDIGVLAKPHVQSKSIQCHIVGESVALSPFKQWSREIATSPFKLPLPDDEIKKVSSPSITSGSPDPECSEESGTFQVKSRSSDSEEEMQSQHYKIMCQEITCKKT